MSHLGRLSRFVVLVVEDHPGDADLIRLAFGRARPELPVRTVPDGESAIAYLSRQEPYLDRAKYPVPSVVLLDLGLPRMSGLEVLKWIRSRPEYHDMPVVILTSSEHPADLKDAYAAGTSSFIPKPTDGHGFIEMMNALCAYWELNVR